jgi:sec-independent protein translocase protein TatC
MSDHSPTEAPSHETSSMPLWDHIEELRWVLIKCLLALLVAGVLTSLFAFQFKALLDWPLQQGLHIAGKTGPFELYARGPFEPFSVFFQVIMLGSIGLALPFCLWFIASFVAPGLTEQESRLLKPFCLAMLGLFLAGALFSYFIVLPMMMAASFWMSGLMQLQELWSPATYYGAVVWMSLGMGLLFEFPLVIILLQLLGIVDTAMLCAGRRYAFVVLLILAALITPTGDPVTLALVALPLYGLYEAAIAIGRRLPKPAPAP